MLTRWLPSQGRLWAIQPQIRVGETLLLAVNNGVCRAPVLLSYMADPFRKGNGKKTLSSSPFELSVYQLVLNLQLRESLTWRDLGAERSLPGLPAESVQASLRAEAVPGLSRP